MGNQLGHSIKVISEYSHVAQCAVQLTSSTSVVMVTGNSFILKMIPNCLVLLVFRKNNVVAKSTLAGF